MASDQSKGSLLVFGTMYANDLACGVLVEAMAAVRKSPRYCHRLRYDGERLDAWRKQYERRLHAILRRYDEPFMEMCDHYTETMREPVDTIYRVLCNDFLRQRVEEPYVCARLAFASVMAAAASWVYRGAIPYASRLLGNSARFRFLDFTPLTKMLDDYCEAWGAMPEDRDGQLKRAADVLQIRLNDPKAVVDANNAGGQRKEEWKI